MSYLGKSPSQGTRNRFYFTASGGETSLSGTDDNGNTLTFADGAFVDVSVNGISLVAGTDYNTTTANTIGGLTALVASDVVEIVAYDVFNIFSGSVNGPLNVSETVTASAFSGDGSALTGIPSPTLTSLGIANHDQVTVTAGGAVTATSFSGDGSALTNLPAAGISAVVDDTTPQLGGNLSTNGNDITFGDLDMAVFGASNDFKIYHSGANSFVSDQGTGNLYLATDGTSVNITRGNGVENMGVFTANGAVTLYHNNIAKIATTTTGVDVTGDASISGGVYLGGTGSANYLDDYEQGTWTPIADNGFSAGATYSNQFGYYTKIGNQVFVDFFMQFNVATGDGSIIRVGGLPFQTGSDFRRGGGLSSYQTVVSGKTLQFYANFGINSINAFVDGSTQATTSASVNGLIIVGCYTYLIQ